MGRAPEWWWADTMGVAHPLTAEEVKTTKPTKPSHNQARGGEVPMKITDPVHRVDERGQ